ncbi:MAG: hypothetical protein AAF984_01260 [Verrucomicrobiota bacterium]
MQKRKDTLKKISQKGEDAGYQAGYAFAQKVLSLWPLSLLRKHKRDTIRSLFVQEAEAEQPVGKFGFFAYTNQPELAYFFGPRGTLQEFKDYFLMHAWPVNPFEPHSIKQGSPQVKPTLASLDRRVLTHSQWKLYQFKKLTPFFLIFNPNQTFRPYLLAEAYADRARNSKGLNEAKAELHAQCLKCLEAI